MRKKLLLIALFALTSLAAKGDPTTAMTRLADGFDFPVGKPNGDGYHKSRGFTVHGHLGEDWIGEGGSGSAFRDPVYAAGNGIVTLARDFRRAWGNVVVVRHAFMEEGQVKYADSLYAHLDKILVREGQQVARGEQVGTIGNCHGLYPPHLHFEFHKNLEIGVVHTLFAGDYSNYYSPTDFVNSHRSLKSANRVTTVAMNNYVMPSFAGVPALPPAAPATVANQVMSQTKKSGFHITRYDSFRD
jgi:murein DD-endopeptidase MepM/ murein hydrolase activator NlpD